MSLESEIRQLINDTISGKYIGRLRVQKEEYPDGSLLWGLFLYLNVESSPIILAYQGSLEEFKDFIRREIKARKLEFVSYYKLEMDNGDDNDDYYE